MSSDQISPNLSDDYKYKELVKLDIAISQWYLMQRAAADSVENTLGYKYGPNEQNKSEYVILDEQESAITLLENDTSNESQRSSKAWKNLQFKAANILRTSLGKSHLIPDENISSSSLIKLQRTDLFEIESYRQLLK